MLCTNSVDAILHLGVIIICVLYPEPIIGFFGSDTFLNKNPYNDNERRYMGFDVCEKKGVSGRLSVDQIMPHTDTKV